MSKVKNQHYVPQTYLKQFADDHEQIWFFDKVTRTSKRTNIRNVASETYFYDFGAKVQRDIEARLAALPESELSAETKRAMLDPQFVEHEMGKIEKDFSGKLDEVIRTVDATQTFTQEQKAQLAYFTTVQMVRGPEFRKTHLERLEKGMDAIAQMLIAMKFGDDAVGRVQVTLTANQDAYEHARMMFNKEFIQTSMAILLHNYIWHIGITPSEKSLYTSDTPVVMRSHSDESAYGIGSRGVEIMFPLTQHHILVLHERSYFAPYEFLDCQTVQLTLDNILYFNSFQILRSYRYVYCPSSDFELAVNICAESPQICEPNRDRVEVRGGVQALLEKKRRATT